MQSSSSSSSHYNEGVAFVQGLIDHLGWNSAQISADWPGAMINIYKEAGKTYLRDLYDASADLLPADALEEMAQPIMKTWQGTQGVHDWWDDVWLSHAWVQTILADAVALRSSRDCVHPEMLLALKTEIEGRYIVDEWYGKRREQDSWTAAKEKKRLDHERYRQVLDEVLEILQQEAERWWEGIAASLQGAQDEIFRLGNGNA